LEHVLNEPINFLVDLGLEEELRVMLHALSLLAHRFEKLSVPLNLFLVPKVSLEPILLNTYRLKHLVLEGVRELFPEALKHSAVTLSDDLVL